MRIEPKQLKAFLLDTGLLNESDIEGAEKVAREKNIRLEEALKNLGKISEDDIARLKAYILGIPFVNLIEEKIEPEILSIIPEPIARSHNIVAFRKKGNNLEVAMLDPEDLRTIEFIKKKEPGLKILHRLTTPESVKNVLRQYQKTLEVEFGEIIKKEAGIIKPIREEETVEEKE